jgi:hypothetical protein
MKPRLILQSLALALLLPAGALSFDDKGADANALPKVPAGVTVHGVKQRFSRGFRVLNAEIGSKIDPFSPSEPKTALDFQRLTP